MGNLLAGAIGVFIGAVITSIIAIILFRKEMKIISNRFFIEKLLNELQEIYIAQLSNEEIKNDSINTINAFQGVCFEEMKILNDDLDILKDAMLKYNNGREKTINLTSTSQEEIQAKKIIENTISELMNKIRKLT